MIIELVGLDIGQFQWISHKLISEVCDIIVWKGMQWLFG